MSFFDNVDDLDTIPDDPFGLPDNTYKVRIVEAKYGPTQGTKEDANPKFGITVKYQITEGDYVTAFPFTEWLHTPGGSDDPTSPDIRRSLSNLKKHFLAYGFGVDEIRGIKPDGEEVPALVDREVFVKVRTRPDKNQRKQIQVQDLFSIDSEDADELSTGSKNSIVDF